MDMNEYIAYTRVNFIGFIGIFIFRISRNFHCEIFDSHTDVDNSEIILQDTNVCMYVNKHDLNTFSHE